jgi:hypothetical protein
MERAKVRDCSDLGSDINSAVPTPAKSQFGTRPSKYSTSVLGCTDQINHIAWQRAGDAKPHRADISRSLDYLETRTDVRKDRIGFLRIDIGKRLAISKPNMTSLMNADKFFISDFFVFLQDKSGSSILTKESRKSNVPETQRCSALM